MPSKVPNLSLRGLVWFLPRLVTTSLGLLFALIAFAFAAAAVLMQSLTRWVVARS